MTTTSPRLAQRIYTEAADKGCLRWMRQSPAATQVRAPAR